MTPDDKTMLALAALTYRGFGENSEAKIADALLPWLPKLGDEGLGTWELVWGPATFRAKTSLFDDAMVYVARQTDVPAGERPRYAVAIRGTNPVSLFDWFFGDLFVQLKVPWAKDRAAAGHLSASTALGLAIIQHLAAQHPPSPASNLGALADDVTSGLAKLAGALPEVLPFEAFERPDSFGGVALALRLAELTRRSGGGMRSNALDGLQEILGGATRSLREAPDQAVFDRLLERIAATPDPGKTLLAYLESCVPSNARVAVTGHSKGGALAIATALWLDETWAAASDRTIECFSFAGPTAGDATFKQHYDARLAARTRAVVNERDIVPHAWAVTHLLAIREQYPLLAPAITLLAGSVENHGYSQAGGAVTRFDRGPGPHGSVMLEIIHQHLDAYLAAAGFGPEWNARSIFLG